MKRFTPFLIVLLFAACGDNKVANNDADEKNQSDTTAPANTSTPPAKSDASPVEPKIDPDSSLAEGLVKLTELAQKQELANQFNEAATTWKKIHSQLVAEFGTDSWQAANAGLAMNVALKEAKFTESEIQTLEQMRVIQKRFYSELAAQQTVAALSDSEQLVSSSMSLFGPESVMYARQLFQQANLQQKLGNTQPAISNYHKAIDIFKTSFVDQHPELEVAHGELGKLYLAMKQISPAIANLKEATRLAGGIWGESSLQYALHANQLGVAYHQSGQLDVAEPILKACEVIRRQALGTNHPLVGHSLMNLGTVYSEKKQFVKAADCLSQALAIFDSSDDLKKVFSPIAQRKLATVHMLNSRPDSAEPLLKSLLEQALSQNAEPALVAQAKYRYAVALARQGKYDLAEPVLEQALATQRSQLGETNRDTINSLQVMAMLLDRTGRAQEAAKINQQLQKMAQQSDNGFRRF